jgi:hypothetical protein
MPRALSGSSPFDMVGQAYEDWDTERLACLSGRARPPSALTAADLTDLADLTDVTALSAVGALLDRAVTATPQADRLAANVIPSWPRFEVLTLADGTNAAPKSRTAAARRSSEPLRLWQTH